MQPTKMFRGDWWLSGAYPHSPALPTAPEMQPKYTVLARALISPNSWTLMSP